MAEHINFDPNKLVCRLAEPADLNDVININRNVYIKFDYLPAKYMEYQHNSGYYQFVAVYDGLIVGYRAMFCVEKNKIFWSMSARTSPKFQNYGISTILSTFIGEYLGATNAIKRATMRLTGLYRPKPNERLLMKWSILAYELDSKPVQTSVNQLLSNATLPKDVPIDTISGILQNPDAIGYLQKISPFIVLPGSDWVATEVNEHSLISMVKRHPTYVTFNNENTRIEAISNYTTCFHLDGSLLVSFHYFGKPDISLWKSHMCKCISGFLKFVTKRINLRVMFHYPDGLSADTAHCFLEPVFGQQFAEDWLTIEHAAFVEFIPASSLQR